MYAATINSVNQPLEPLFQKEIFVDAWDRYLRPNWKKNDTVTNIENKVF